MFFRKRVFSDPFFKSFRRMGRIFDEMDHYLHQGHDHGLHQGTDFPLVDIWSGQEGVVLTAEIPGAEAEDLDVTVLGDTLTIRGKREPAELGEREGYVRQERFTGEFVRTVQLPYATDPEKMDAEYRHGVLTIRLTRPEADKPQRITIGNGS